MTRPQRNLFFCFGKTSRSKWSWLLRSRYYKHVFLLIFDGEYWVAVHPLGKSWRVESLGKKPIDYITRIEKALKLTSVIGVWSNEPCVEGDINPFFGVGMMCNQVVVKASGLKLPFTRTPHDLRDVLLKRNGIGYQIFYKTEAPNCRPDEDFVMFA